MDQLKRKLNCLFIQEDNHEQSLTSFTAPTEVIEWVKHCVSIHEARSILGFIQIDFIFVNVDECRDQDLEDLMLSSPGSDLVLLTQKPDYQITHIDQRVFDCLVLPVSSSRLKLFLRRLTEHFIHQSQAGQEAKPTSGPVILVKSGSHQYQLQAADIIYIESDGEYLKYHTQKGRYLALGSLRRLARNLSADFVQVHRSYVVNRNFVIAKKKNQLELIGSTIIPIGKTYRNAFQFMSSAVLL